MKGSLMKRKQMIASLALVLASAACASGSGGAGSTGTSAEPASSGGQGLEEVFAGRFPGVEVFRVPSGGIRIRIRGASTLLGNSDPLYIIDGTRVQSGTGGLLFLDPSDIQRIQVLKDIGSTAAYGSDGANGVILITTKTAR
jgi:TonB-dependent SusC/RagA subfamily outer membrane receptor